MKELLKFLYYKIIVPIIEPAIVNVFHFIWYHSPNTWPKNTFLGHEILQCPFDLQLYQELLFKTKPDFVLQTGIAGGGSLLYFATLFDIMNCPPESIVIGVDITLSENAKKLEHPRIHVIEGNSIGSDTLQKLDRLINMRRGFVILDSDHSKNHVLAELEIYNRFVAPNSYLVVEDTNVNGHPVSPLYGPGPLEAVNKFLKHNTEFYRDDDIWKRNKFSFHQRGWLKRK